MIGNRLQVSGYSICVLFLLLFPLTCTLSTISAADSSPSADPLRQSDSEASIKDKLEELKREIASKAAKLKQEVNRKLENKAYAGMVKTKSQTSLTLASNTGPKLVSTNIDTIFESKVKGVKKFSQKTIAEEDYVAALGDIDETGVLTAKKIVLLPTKNSQLKTYIWGQVISISDKLLTVKDRTLKNIAVSNPSDIKLKINDFIIATGVKNKNDIFETEFVHLIVQGGILKSKKAATSSAQIASPSASPKPTKSPSPTPKK